jgi:hypothetical protein
MMWCPGRCAEFMDGGGDIDQPGSLFATGRDRLHGIADRHDFLVGSLKVVEHG